MDWTDYAQIATQLYDAYNKSKDPKFKQLPEDPSLTMLRSKLLGFIDNSPTRNAFGSMLGSQMQNAGKGFSMPEGYNGFKPYTSGPVNYDMSKILPNIFGATGTNPTTGTGTPGAVKPPAPGGGSGGFVPGDNGSVSPDPNDSKHRVPNMYGNTGSLIGNSPQVFDPNMQGRPGVTSPAGENPNIVDIKNRNDPGYGTPSGTGVLNTDIDAKGIMSAFNNLPAWAKGSISVAVSLIAGSMGIPAGIVMDVLKKFGGSQANTGSTIPGSISGSQAGQNFGKP